MGIRCVKFFVNFLMLFVENYHDAFEFVDIMFEILLLRFWTRRVGRVLPFLSANFEFKSSFVSEVVDAFNALNNRTFLVNLIFAQLIASQH